MARPLRIEFENALYHLCARGNARERIFAGEKDQAHFVALLEASAARFDVAMIAFVLMGNHFHLIAQTRRANLTRWMHWLSVSYTVYFNRRHQRSGHLFQGRFKSILVQGNERYLLNLSRYVHLNPVRGLVVGRGTPTERRERLRVFKWSSYPGYAGIGKQFPFVEEAMVLSEMGGPKRRQGLAYRRFVEEGLVREVENPFEAVRWQAVLGSESFAQKIRDRVKEKGKAAREIKSLKEMKPQVAPEEVIARVSRKYRIPRDRLVEGSYGVEARNVAMWLVWEGGDRTLREIGELFGGLDYAAVAQRIARVRHSMDQKSAEKIKKQMLNI